MGETRNIDLKMYLDVMALLPGVTLQDVEQTKQLFTKALGTMPQNLTFDRDVEQGDGIVSFVARVSNGDGTMRRARFFLTEDGSLSAADHSFRGTLPFKNSSFFFGGIFGLSEMRFRSSEGVSVSRIAQGVLEDRGVFLPENAGGPERARGTDDFIPFYGDEIIESARTLYNCARKRGSLQACGSSTAVHALATIRSHIEARASASREQRLQEELADAKRQLQASQVREQEALRRWREGARVSSTVPISSKPALPRNSRPSRDSSAGSDRGLAMPDRMQVDRGGNGGGRHRDEGGPMGRYQ